MNIYIAITSSYAIVVNNKTLYDDKFFSFDKKQNTVIYLSIFVYTYA